LRMAVAAPWDPHPTIHNGCRKATPANTASGWCQPKRRVLYPSFREENWRWDEAKRARRQKEKEGGGECREGGPTGLTVLIRRAECRGILPKRAKIERGAGKKGERKDEQKKGEIGDRSTWTEGRGGSGCGEGCMGENMGRRRKRGGAGIRWRGLGERIIRGSQPHCGGGKASVRCLRIPSTDK